MSEIKPRPSIENSIIVAIEDSMGDFLYHPIFEHRQTDVEEAIQELYDWIVKYGVGEYARGANKARQDMEEHDKLFGE